MDKIIIKPTKITRWLTSSRMQVKKWVTPIASAYNRRWELCTSTSHWDTSMSPQTSERAAEATCAGLAEDFTFVVVNHSRKWQDMASQDHKWRRGSRCSYQEDERLAMQSRGPGGWESSSKEQVNSPQSLDGRPLKNGKSPRAYITPGEGSLRWVNQISPSGQSPPKKRKHTVN